MPCGAKVGLGAGHIVLHGIQLPKKSTVPNFRPVIVAKRSPISATAEHLFYHRKVFLHL